MPLQIPTRAEIVSRAQSYVRTYLPDLDPTVTGRRGFIGGFVKSIASSLHDWYVKLKRFADYEPWPQTATIAFFEQGWWLDITNLPRNPPAAAQGGVVFTGTNGTIIPAGQTLTFNGNTYTLDTSVTIVDQTVYGTSSYVTPGRGRFVTDEPHGLASGMSLTFVASIDTALDGTFEIEVLDLTTIEYDIPGAAGANPISTTLSRYEGTFATGIVTASATGPGSNIDSGGTMSFDAVPAGADSTVRVAAGGIADGSDLEDLEDWRGRVLQALGTDFGMFTADEIRIVAKTVPGVTRVFVRTPVRVPTEGWPLEGQVRISFLRENDADPIPSPLEVEQVRNVIHTQLVPCHTLTDDVEVLAPESYPLDVRFQYITPDTAGMRLAITANLRQFLNERAEWGGTIKFDDLKCAVNGSFDLETGQVLTDFVFNTPSDDVVLPVDAYPVLNSIVWRVAS